MIINFDSYRSIAKGSEQMVLYGWQKCLFEVLDSNRLVIKIKKIITYRIGDLSRCIKTLEERTIEQIQLDDSEDIDQICKAGIVNLILENYKRKKEDLPIIPF